MMSLSPFISVRALKSLSSQRQARCHLCRAASTISDSFPKLESATGRARKRRARKAKLWRDASRSAGDSSYRQVMDDYEVVPPYPKGKPWRVLWPNTHDNPKGVKTNGGDWRLPRWEEVKKGWELYMETWEDGIRGEPSPEKLRERARKAAEEERALAIHQDEASAVSDIKTNVTQNLEVARESARYLVEEAKLRSDIHSKDDLRKAAEDAMKLATECLKEFMAGYREGRDREIDKMLNEYFNENNSSLRTDDDGVLETEKRRRKPKRASLR